MGNEFQKNFNEIHKMIEKNFLKILIIISKNKIQKKKYWNNKKIVDIGKNKWKKILNLYVKELIEYEKKQLF